MILITKPNWLILFRYIIAIYCENDIKFVNILWKKMQTFNVKECDVYAVKNEFMFTC